MLKGSAFGNTESVRLWEPGLTINSVMIYGQLYVYNEYHELHVRMVGFDNTLTFRYLGESGRIERVSPRTSQRPHHRIQVLTAPSHSIFGDGVLVAPKTKLPKKLKWTPLGISGRGFKSFTGSSEPRNPAR